MQRQKSIFVTMLVAVLCLGGCNEPTEKSAGTSAVQQESASVQRGDAAAKLGGPARDLNPPLNIGDLPVTNKPVVLIYYVNETAPDEAERKNLKSLTEWLREDGHPEIAPHADSIEFDTKKFPRVVDADVAVLRDRHAEASEKRPNVVIFTNRLAQQGKFQLLHRDQPGVLQEKTFDLPANRPGLYGSYPLASRETLAQALKAAASLFPAKDYEYALITKSHGSGEIVVSPRYQVVVGELNREAFLKQINSEHQASLAKKLQGATPLFSAANTKLVDGKGRGLISKNGLIYWENVGRIYLSGGKDAVFLADRAGTAFATPEGKKILYSNKRLVIEGTTQNVLEAGDKPAEMLAILASGMILQNMPDKDILPASMHPRFIPLLSSKATAGLVLAKGGMALPILEGDKQTTPILDGDKQTTPILDGDKQTTPILEADKQTIPILDGDKQMTPILEGDKATMPILGILKEYDPILDTDKATSPILKSDKLSVPSLYYDGTLAGDGTSALGSVSSNSARYGISKEQFVEMLKQSHEGAGMVFRLVFMESCASELPASIVRKLQTPEGSKSIGQIWSSDSRGLEYVTIDFGKVFDRLAASPAFVDALQSSLQAKYEFDRTKK